jgi:succinate-semialdehyde dehydrogenase / glutarate-semialdehyde dehydrogenase
VTKAEEADLLAATPTGLWIGGEWCDGGAGRFPVLDPATGDLLAEVADAGPADGLAALAAAAGAQRSWARVAPRERAEILRRTFELLTARAGELALLMTLEMGKPLAEARGEVAYAAEFFRWFSEEACRVEGSYRTAPQGGARLVSVRQPVGPCVLVTPWNFPLAMGARKLAPALAAGCTAVVKPAAETPLSMLALAAVLAEAGVPPGVVGVVPTTRAAALVEPLLRDPRTRKLSFTGSTAVGRRLVELSAHGLLRTSMELGGNAAFLVCADADLDTAVDAAVLAKTRNAGEACTAANRFLVHEAVAGEFVERLTGRMAALVVGRGTEPGVQIGPLITEQARSGVEALAGAAVAGGARVTTGGRRPDGPGWFYPPTVLTGVDPVAALLHVEVFGPVAPVVVVRSDDEAIRVANDTEYGLAAYVCTRDLDRALRLAEELECGMVGVNTGLVSNPAAPFGGVKASGFGREGGREGIEEYLALKHVGIATSA